MDPYVKEAVSYHFEKLEQSVAWEEANLVAAEASLDAVKERLHDLTAKRDALQEFLKPSPREWKSLPDVPEGVTVESRSEAGTSGTGHPLLIRRSETFGSEYKWSGFGAWTPWFSPTELAQADRVWGPYIEVIS